MERAVAAFPAPMLETSLSASNCKALKLEYSTYNPPSKFVPHPCDLTFLKLKLKLANITLDKSN
jgi:hypothetical protein